MTREIKFRGLRADGQGWVQGDLLTGVGNKKGKFYVLPVVKNLASIEGCHPLDGLEVIPSTDGTFTVTDKIGVSLFIIAKAFIVLAVAYKCLLINII